MEAAPVPFSGNSLSRSRNTIQKDKLSLIPFSRTPRTKTLILGNTD